MKGVESEHCNRLRLRLGITDTESFERGFCAGPQLSLWPFWVKPKSCAKGGAELAAINPEKLPEISQQSTTGAPPVTKQEELSY